MKFVITYLLSFILLFIALLNLNWAFGSGFLNRFSKAFVENEEQKFKKVIHITAFIVLLIFAFIILIASGVIQLQMDNYIFKSGAFGIGLTFLARAYGDRKKYGILKTIKDTEEAELDSKFITPICIILSFLVFSIVLLF